MAYSQVNCIKFLFKFSIHEFSIVEISCTIFLSLGKKSPRPIHDFFSGLFAVNVCGFFCAVQER